MPRIEKNWPDDLTPIMRSHDWGRLILVPVKESLDNNAPNAQIYRVSDKKLFPPQHLQSIFKFSYFPNEWHRVFEEELNEDETDETEQAPDDDEN